MAERRAPGRDRSEGGGRGVAQDLVGQIRAAHGR
jgi:hypothetical protein